MQSSWTRCAKSTRATSATSAPFEVKVGLGVFEMPFEDIVFKGGKCVLCDAFAAREVR